jgi:trigger factor
MVEDMKPTAASNVKTGLVLDAVAKAEGLEVTEQEVGEAIMQMAAASRVDPKTFEERLRKNGRYQTIRWQILRDKAADFIAANAVPLTEGEAAVAEAKKSLAKTTKAKKAAAAAEAATEPAAEEAPEAEATAPAEAAEAPESDAAAPAETDAPEAE